MLDGGQGSLRHAERAGGTIDSDTLARLRRSRELHLSHYGGNRLPYGCIAARGIRQRLVKLGGRDAGRVLDVIDAGCGYASACLGAAHLAVTRALEARSTDTSYVSDELASAGRAALLDMLFGPEGLWRQRFPSDDFCVSGRNSGSEGMELALRLVLESRFDARTLQPDPDRADRNSILAFEGAWHGWTPGVLSLVNRRHFRVGLPSIETGLPYGYEARFVPFGRLDVLEAAFGQYGNTLLAVVVEPVQGDAGIIVPPAGYLRRLAQLCRENEVFLVADEVLTFAKTGRFFAMTDEAGPIATDITVIGKSLGMGMVSTSMVIARRGFKVRPSGAVATSDLRPTTCAIIEHGIRFITERGLLECSMALGESLREALTAEVVAAFPRVYTGVRGVGLLNGIELTEEAAAQVLRLREALIESGVFVEIMSGSGPRTCGARYVLPTLRVAPALTVSSDEIAEIVSCIRLGTKRLELGGRA